MRHFVRWPLAALLLVTAEYGASQASGGDYELKRYTVDAGGGVFTGGSRYRVTATVGQADATPVFAGGGYTVTGGFWGRAEAGDRLFKNGFE